jgi:hypothetical protein
MKSWHLQRSRLKPQLNLIDVLWLVMYTLMVQNSYTIHMGDSTPNRFYISTSHEQISPTIVRHINSHRTSPSISIRHHGVPIIHHQPTALTSSQHQQSSWQSSKHMWHRQTMANKQRAYTHMVGPLGPDRCDHAAYDLDATKHITLIPHNVLMISENETCVQFVHENHGPISRINFNWLVQLVPISPISRRLYF